MLRRYNKESDLLSASRLNNDWPDLSLCRLNETRAAHKCKRRPRCYLTPAHKIVNAASEAAAIKAGFTLCGTRYCYEYHK